MGVKEDFLRTRIEEMRLSQADISRKTDIPPGTISSILRSEDGIEKTSYGNVRKICEALGVDVDDLERVGPDGRLPERIETPLPEPDNTEEEASVSEDVPGTIADADDGGEKEDGQAVEVPVPAVDPGGFIGYDPEEEGLLEIKRYFVVSRLAACSEEDVGRMVSVIPSVRTVEENGIYAVRLPENRMVVLRKIWRMDNGLLLLAPDRFDEVPRIIRPDLQGFSIVGKVVEDETLADHLC